MFSIEINDIKIIFSRTKDRSRAILAKCSIYDSFKQNKLFFINFI